MLTPSCLWWLLVFTVIVSKRGKASAQSLSGEDFDLPLSDCRSQDIDVFFISSKSVRKTQAIEGLFSRLVDVFMSPNEKITKRVQFAYVEVTDLRGEALNVVFTFSSLAGKLETKKTLEAGKTPAHTSSNISSLTSIEDVILSSTRRNDSSVQRILVFVASPSDNIDVEPFRERGFKICVVSYGTSFSYNFHPTMFLRNVSVLETEISPLKNDHKIAQLLCGTCFEGWFSQDKHAPRASDSIFFSCYHVGLVPNVCVRWHEANELCEQQNSLLVSIETKDELDFLERELPWIIHDLQVENKAYESDSKVKERTDFAYKEWGPEFATYIGLSRQQETLGKRFQWINGAPLVLKRWSLGLPLEGSMQGCVFWGFREPYYEPLSSQDRDRKNETKFAMSGWVDIGCGLQLLQFYTCEMKPKERATTAVWSQTARRASVGSAVFRGDVMEFSATATLASVSAFLSTDGALLRLPPPDTSRNVLPEDLKSLPLFDCFDEQSIHIAYSFVCDHKPHCPNNADEEICGYRPCNPQMEFTCMSSQCVPVEARCDLYPDCFDGSDEVGCSGCSQRQCHDGTCIPRHWWYDNQVDCNGFPNEMMFADEDMQVDGYNETCLFICNRFDCVFESMVNDSVTDCVGPEGPLDDLLSGLEGFYCPRTYGSELVRFPIWSPRCIYFKDRYDTVVGCRETEHLQECEDFMCPEGYMKCPRSYCVPLHMIRNGKFDCPNGEDETELFGTERTWNFACMYDHVKVHPDLVCDGHPHCPRGVDELNCHFTCPHDALICKAGVVVTPTKSSAIDITSLALVDPRTRYLDLSGVRVGQLFPESIVPGGFGNIIFLRLSGCQIVDLTYPLSSIASGQLHDFWTVQFLDLSYNDITTLDSGNILRFMGNLKLLNLSFNTQLETISPDAFRSHADLMYESKIRTLNLSFTDLKVLSSEMFVHLPHLIHLDVRSTGISSLLPSTFPLKFDLAILDLRDNAIIEVYSDSFLGLTVHSELLTDTFKVCCPQVRGPGVMASVCTAPPDPLSSCTNLIGDMAQRIFLWVAGIMAVTGNITVIVYRCKRTKDALKNAYGMFVIHLAFSDLLMGVYLIMIGSADLYFQGEYIWKERTWRQSVVCRLAGALATISSETSIVFILFITIDRFFAIKFPFGNVRISKRLTIGLCLFAWALGATLAVIPLLPPFDHWSMFTAYSMCVGLPLTVGKLPGWVFSASVFIGFNLAMVVTIALGQLLIFRTISAIRKDQGSILKSDNSELRDIAVARQLFLVAMTDFLCWFPVGVMGIFSLNGTEIGLTAYAWSIVFVLPINSALNPVLYTIPTIYDTVRKLKIFQCQRRRQSPATSS